MGRRISFQYVTAVILPFTTINYDFTSCAIPPQTITDSSLNNASVSEAFPATSLYTKKSEARLLRKKDSSLLPHWISPGYMGC